MEKVRDYIKHRTVQGIIDLAGDCADTVQETQGKECYFLQRIGESMHYTAVTNRASVMADISMDIHESLNWQYQAPKDGSAKEKDLAARQKEMGNCKTGNQDKGVARVQRYLRTCKEMARLDKHGAFDWLSVKPSIDPNTLRQNTAYSVLTKALKDLKGEKPKDNSPKISFTAEDVKSWGYQSQRALYLLAHHRKMFDEIPALCQLFEQLGFDVPKRETGKDAAANIGVDPNWRQIVHNNLPAKAKGKQKIAM